VWISGEESFGLSQGDQSGSRIASCAKELPREHRAPPRLGSGGELPTHLLGLGEVAPEGVSDGLQENSLSRGGIGSPIVAHLPGALEGRFWFSSSEQDFGGHGQGPRRQGAPTRVNP
jgi:hypothetical protein